MSQSKGLLLVAGKPGSGKTTAGKSASNILGEEAYYFSIGAELRAIGPEGKSSALSSEVSQYVDELRNYLPIPAFLAHKVLEECIVNNPAHLVIIDGYPQYEDRLPGFKAILDRLNARVVAVCEIDVSDEIAQHRLEERDNRTRDIKEDDEFIKKRLLGYQKNAVPAIKQLSRLYPFKKVDGSLSKRAVADELVRAITEYHR